ncbi:MAG: sigma 54-interacting transcriptional regulator [Treponema sp.]|nr:sigma 54-interacting transcriptional regulator [Treponema sp.]
MDSIGLEELKTLIEINSRINSNYTELDTLLVYILEAAMRLVQCESSSLLLVNADGTLSFVVALGPKGAEAKNIPIDKNSIAGWVASHKEPLILKDVPSDARFSDHVQRKTGYVSRTMIAVPLCVKDECIGVIELINKVGERYFDAGDLQILNMFCDLAGIAYKNAENYQSAQNRISTLQSSLSANGEFHTFIAKSPAILDLLKMIDEIARTNLSVIITGESGVGKELFAEQIHKKSDRAGKPFIRVNCAALAPSLLESELFGHVKGAFTDAKTDHKGYFETADSGTIFLDEIGEMPLELQAKLLRVIQSKEFQKVGSSKTISVDVRVVAATNRDLEAMMREKKFRSDLYFRLSGVPIKVPPLRERKEDIPVLADFFLEKFSRETKKNFTGFSPSAMDALHSYYWPGNIRELENSIERACVLGKPPLIHALDLRINNVVESADNNIVENIVSECISATDCDRSLKGAMNRFKRAYVLKVLEDTSWNKTKAGQVLGIQRTYVSRLLNELAIYR